MTNLGYCCINLTLREQGIYTNRTMFDPRKDREIRTWLYNNTNGVKVEKDTKHVLYNTFNPLDDPLDEEYDDKIKSISYRTFIQVLNRFIKDKTIILKEKHKTDIPFFKYAGSLALLNLKDLLKILEWNKENDINIFRISSTIFPWMSEYRFEDLPNFIEIKNTLEKIGKYVLDNDMRVGFHPGQFCVLPSPTPKVVDSTINELDKSARILDLMGLPINHKFSLNIHVGGSYGDKESTLKRFVENFSRLSSSAKSRLVIENDDKASQYSVVDLYEGLHKHINIPITFDFFHHLFCTGDLDQDSAAKLAASTWPDDIRPLAHYSSSRKIHEDSKVVNRSHADYLYEEMPAISKIFDIEIEAKAKELALFKYTQGKYCV